MSSRLVATARARLRPSACSSVATTSCCSRYAAAVRPADRQVHGRHTTFTPACQNASVEVRNWSSPGSPTPAWPNAITRGRFSTEAKATSRPSRARDRWNCSNSGRRRSAALVSRSLAPVRSGSSVGSASTAVVSIGRPARSARIASDARREARASSRCRPARTRSASIAAASRPRAVPASTRARTAARRASRSVTSASYSAERFSRRNAEKKAAFTSDLSW